MWVGVYLLRDLKGSRRVWFVVEKPMQKFVKLLAAALGNISKGVRKKDVNLFVCTPSVMVRQMPLYWSQDSMALSAQTQVWVLKVVGIFHILTLAVSLFEGHF